MSRKGHSFLHEYPRIRVDRFTESRERIPAYLKRPQARRREYDSNGEAQYADAPWQDLELAGTDDCFPHPTIQLLTHIHVDHLEGLNSPLYNAAPIYCSYQTKEMLLRLEPGPSRTAGEAGVAMGSHGRKRPYEWLKLTQQEASIRRRETGSSVAPRDILHPLPLNTPTSVQYLPGVKVKLTLLDANHMPGAVMFLVEGHRGAVLHTGDCRAEKWWLEGLVRNPAMQRYTSWEEAKAIASKEEMENSPMLRSQAEQIEATQVVLTQAVPQASIDTHDSRTQASESPEALRTRERERPTSRDLRLKNIYIDDEGIASPEWPMAKKDAVLDLISLMERYPSDTNFFIDLFTWGYEEIYLAIGKTFSDRGSGPRVHVDPYKKKMYAAADDPVLSFLTTKTTTRFHACERKGDCEFLSPDERLAGERDAFESLSQHWTGPAPMPPAAEELAVTPSPRQPQGPLTVYIKPISSSKKAWKVLSDKLHDEIGRANEGKSPYPLWLACPIDRHSTLPELQRLVRAFRPATVTPTTSHPDHYFLAAKYLGPALGPRGQDRINAEAKTAIGAKHWAKYEAALAGSGAATEGDTVAEEIRRFREALRQTLDLSQSPRHTYEEAEKEGYDADVSVMPSAYSAPAITSLSRPQRQPDIAPLVSQAVLRVRQTEGASKGEESDSSFAVEPPPAALGSTTELSEDLARRYFIVLRMFIEPGLRLKNLPGGTEGPQAWRAVRKLRPDYARRTEEVMHKEVGVVPPSWTRSRRSSAAPSPRPAFAEPEGVVPALDTGPRSDLHGNVDLSQQEQQELVADGVESVRDVEVLPQEDGAQPSTANAPFAAPIPMDLDEPLGTPPEAVQDWLSPLMVKLGSAPLDLKALSTSELCSTLDLHAMVYNSILQDSLAKSNSLSLLSHYSTGLAYTLTRAFGIWSIVLRPSRNAVKRTWKELVAFARCTELGGRVAALLFTREARDVIDDGVRARLLTTVSSTYELTRGIERESVQRGLTSFVIAPRAGKDAEVLEAEGLRWITRVAATLRFAMDENDTTALPVDLDAASEKGENGHSEAVVPARPYIPPRPLKSIPDPARKRLEL
ncbi:hypothetical protein BCV69DRAFT_147418 [Microstroma glucosiphilum]|uniref:Metallo-beta-lactamase domain-containing protein n=1 Tax=Pseudomicrostroma glucosiphilum TaxID=1684307 RepID=A0A316UF90_9BASI|nr:hypothetical protein BCV69DRAFT_147418 [Pseudomicrostroma glucosiphilum]PWN22563.1 hypothetical protein BCV69DRAFT_147418 [Pseudomicrostroma glucosiphilum]